MCSTRKLFLGSVSVTESQMEMFRRLHLVKLRLFLRVILIHWRFMKKVTSWVDSKKLVGKTLIRFISLLSLYSLFRKIITAPFFLVHFFAACQET
jgi:hypothetical protein